MAMLDGRVAVITGAGRGIGREHALLFARHGARVVVNDLGGATDGSGADHSAAEAVVAEIQSFGGEAIANGDSVTDWDGAERLVEAALAKFGDLHVVVNNAGIVRDRTLVNMREDEFDPVIDVHLKGTFAVTRAAAVYWRQQAKGGGVEDRAIVNTSSGSGLHGNRGQTNYAAAKAGIAAMTIVNAMELASYGVRANCIAPFARTRMSLETPGLGDAIRNAPQGEFDAFGASNVSPLVAYLATERCPFTGQVFSVYGGHVGLYQGWSIVDSVDSDVPWTVEALRAAMARLPLTATPKKQSDALREALDI